MAIRLDPIHALLVVIVHLPVPCLHSKRSACETSVVTKRRYTPALVVLQELKIEQCTAAAREPAQDRLPSCLVLVAVSELDVCVLQGKGFIFWELLETDNDMILRDIGPGALRHKRSANLLKVGVIEDADRAALNVDCVAGIDEGFGGSRGQRRTVL